MATSEEQQQQIIKNLEGQTFTFFEAIVIQKMVDDFTTQTSISWVDYKTKRPVNIGYT